MAVQKLFRVGVISLGAALLTSHAHAIAITDATIHNSLGGLDSSLAAVLGEGKIKNANINGLTGLFAGDAWSLLDRTNTSSKPFNDVNFLLTASIGQRSGDWVVGWLGSALPDYMDYVLVLKSGKQWGAFLFESVSWDVEVLGGTFGISWYNKKGKIAKLRHASIFGRVGEVPDGFDYGTDRLGVGTDGLGVGTDGPDDGTGGAGDKVGLVANDIPAPGSLALLGLGLVPMLIQLRQRPRS